MRAFLLSLALLCGAAHAADLPPCWPKQLGSTGSSYRVGNTEDGNWIGWICVVNGVQKPFGVWAMHEYQVIHPITTGLTTIQTARAYFQANVTNPDDPRMERLRAAMVEGLK